MEFLYYENLCLLIRCGVCAYESGGGVLKHILIVLSSLQN